MVIKVQKKIIATMTDLDNIKKLNRLFGIQKMPVDIFYNKKTQIVIFRNKANHKIVDAMRMKPTKFERIAKKGHFFKSRKIKKL